MEKEMTDVIDHSQSDGTTKLLLSHLGVFILCHSKINMNNFIHSINGFRKPTITVISLISQKPITLTQIQFIYHQNYLINQNKMAL